MARYRVIMSDMDETFLDENHRIPTANVEALRRMRERGMMFVPSSGRPYGSIMANFVEIDQELMADSYVISFNGGFINRYGDPEPLTTCAIDRDAASELYLRGIALGMPQHVYVPDGRIFAVDATDAERSRIASVEGVSFYTSDEYPDLPSLIGDEAVVKMIYVDEDLAALQRLGSEMRPWLEPRGIDATYSSGRYLELVCAGVSKGTGLIHLSKLLGIPVSEIVAMGDSSNDIDMIQAAGLGVGVANVTDDVRPSCDVVLETRGIDGALPELLELLGASPNK